MNSIYLIISVLIFILDVKMKYFKNKSVKYVVGGIKHDVLTEKSF